MQHYLSIQMKPVSALPVIQIVGCEMLATGWNLHPPRTSCRRGTAVRNNHLVVVHGWWRRRSCSRPRCRIIAAAGAELQISLLHASDEARCVGACESWIFSSGFLYPPPSRISHYVDHRRPVRQSTSSDVEESPSFRWHSLHIVIADTLDDDPDSSHDARSQRWCKSWELEQYCMMLPGRSGSTGFCWRKPPSR